MAVKKSELYSILWEACNKLRGGVEPSRYKDYVLVLLFFKYVSDRYKGKRFAEFEVNEGASFDDLVKAAGKSDVGERVDIIIQKFLEDNKLKGLLPDVSFNNPDELGKGKELVDKVSGLIRVFQNPAMDANTIWSVSYDIKNNSIYRIDGNPKRKKYKIDTRLNLKNNFMFKVNLRQ
ncbi:type I restriction-modification system subunit M N-terminal domain-containing protein [Streptococcus dysgalactiae]|uniref:type I restriction-modification system subunit M N-terminal domain-containing protein n=1 Tax=Streptococcus dysgalactiae TaxID=1334 RepID=UPI003F763EA5